MPTNSDGLFELGKLENVTAIEVEPTKKRFDLLRDLVNVPSRICRKASTAIRIPFSASSNKPRVSIYDQQYSSDISQAAKYDSGYVVISKLPPGDYVVYIDDVLSAKVALHVSEGTEFECHLGKYILSNSRILQLSEDAPLQIKLDGFNAMTRCHVVVTSLMPVFSP